MNAKLAVFMAAALFAATAYAGEEAHHKMEIKVVTDDGNGESIVVIDSDDLDFRLHDLQIGENRSIVDKEGRSILITRAEDGFTLNIDGKTVELPEIDMRGRHFAPGVDFDVRVMDHGTAPYGLWEPDGVMIISGKEIDEATQQIIRTALESTGHESVNFTGGHGGGLHQVHVIEKVVEVAE